MKDIENDLVRSFNKIDSFWELTTDTSLSQHYVDYEDSLVVANKKFKLKLLSYTSKYPTTLNYDFSRIKYLFIATSQDHKFRIYSWDTWTGGTEHFFAHLIQFQGEKVESVESKTFGKNTMDDDDPSGLYSEVFQLSIDNRKIYYGYFHSSASTRDAFDGLQLFEIGNQGLNDSLKLFKTEKNLSNILGFDFDFFSVVDRKERPIKLIECSDDGKTIRIPVIDDKEQVTNKWITYRFDGKYFVESKN